MNVGLPGAGLAGLFYLATALMMPLLELARTLSGRSSMARWRWVAGQTGLALAIVGALWGTAWLVTQLLPAGILTALRETGQRTADLFGVAPTVVTLGTLAAVLCITEILRLCLMPRSEKA